MIGQMLTELFERDLTRLKEEIGHYDDEKTMWEIKGDIKNSAANLALHLVGNLKHFIGAILGKSGYVRYREAEFADKNVPREEIIKSIDETIDVIKKTLSEITEEELNKPYPVEVLRNRKDMNKKYFLVHLYGHLNYHLGQVNYHRRLLS